MSVEVQHYVLVWIVYLVVILLLALLRKRVDGEGVYARFVFPILVIFLNIAMVVVLGRLGKL